MTTKHKRLVQDFFDIQDHEVQKLVDTKNPYWLKFRDFWWSIKERDVEFISPKQAQWLQDVEDELVNKWRPKWMEEEGMEQTEF